MTYLSLSVFIVIIVSYSYASTEVTEAKLPSQSEIVPQKGKSASGIKYLLNSLLRTAKKVGFHNEQKFVISEMDADNSEIQIGSPTSHSTGTKPNSNITRDIKAVSVHSDNNVISKILDSHLMTEVNEVKSNSTAAHEQLGSELFSSSKIYHTKSVQQQPETFSDFLSSRPRTRRPKQQSANRIQVLQKFTQSLKAKQELKKYIGGTRCTCFTTIHCECCVSLQLYEGLSVHEVCIELEAVPKKILLKGSARFDNQTIYSGQLDPSVAPICLSQIPTLCIIINHIDFNNREICAKLNLLFFTLMKFPCVLLQNGTVVTEPNNY